MPNSTARLTPLHAYLFHVSWLRSRATVWFLLYIVQTHGFQRALPHTVKVEQLNYDEHQGHSRLLYLYIFILTLLYHFNAFVFSF